MQQSAQGQLPVLVVELFVLIVEEAHPPLQIRPALILLLKTKARLAVNQDIQAAVVVAPENLLDPGRTTRLLHLRARVVQQAEDHVALQALTDHLLVPLLENVQGQRLARQQNDSQGKQRYQDALGHACWLSCGVSKLTVRAGTALRWLA